MKEQTGRAAARAQERRIRRYERKLNEAGRAISGFETALERFAAAQQKLAELNDYYGSADWRADFDASEAGSLPADLRCGVLSEDGVWNLLERNRELIDDAKACLDRLGRSE